VDEDRSGAEPSRWDSDDELMARLGVLFRKYDGPPGTAVELARLSLGLRTLDAELAALTADSRTDRPLEGVRAADVGTAPRLLTFEAADLAVELEVSGTGGSRRLLGQLVPAGPATIEVRQPSGAAASPVDADDRGRFALDGVAPGPVSLVCHRAGRRAVATAWTTVD
jgi:hypothetical protein